MDELNMIGLWWLPAKPSEKIAGTLIFTANEGIKLTLVGALGGLSAMFDQGIIGNLHGIADNKIVTLQEAYTKSLGTNFPGPHKHILGARRVFVGAHLEDSELFLNRIDIGLEYLPEFTNHSSLITNIERNESGGWKGLKAEVASQDPIAIGPVKGGEASIRFGWSQDSESFRSLTLKERCSLTIEFNKTHGLSEVLEDYVWPIQDFVTMATDKPNAVVSLSFENPALLDGQPKPRAATIEIFERSRTGAERDHKNTLTRPHMLFTLADLKSNQLNKWLTVERRYKPVVGILFGQRYSKGVHLENLLLNGVSAVEAFHRRRFTNTILDKPEWKAKKKRIVSTIDKGEIDFLNDILQFANEKRLKTRLEEVLAHSGIGNDLVIDAKEWNKQIRGYRNALTHYDPDSPQEIKDYEPLYWLAESISWVMLACLMIEMGFAKKIVLTLLKENQRYLFAQARLTELLATSSH